MFPLAHDRLSSQHYTDSHREAEDRGESGCEWLVNCLIRSYSFLFILLVAKKQVK